MAAAWVLRVGTLAVLALLLLVLVLVLLRRKPALEHGRLLEHVEELRRRILVVMATLLGGTLVAMTVRVDWYDVGGTSLPLPTPALYDTLAAQLFNAMAGHVVPAGVQLVVTGPFDAFKAQFDVALALGIALAVPTGLVQATRFVAPALRPSERRFLALAIVPATALFVLGAAFAFAVVLPVTLAALYQFSDPIGAADLLQAGELAAFVLGFVVAFGVAFQTPLAMAVLSRVGLVDPRSYWRGWRYAVLVVVIAAGILTPDPTVVSQAMLAVPLLGLYFLGAGVATWSARSRAAATAGA
jgi:sec-independent protein translocase protein TatC